jgi:hypothetical protein
MRDRFSSVPGQARRNEVAGRHSPFRVEYPSYFATCPGSAAVWLRSPTVEMRSSVLATPRRVSAGLGQYGLGEEERARC